MKLRKEMVLFAREGLGLLNSVSIHIYTLEGRGSDRTFFRLKWQGRDSAILIHYDPKRLENTYYADIAIFLRDIEIPAPRLIRHDPIRCLILTEDLGETDLWSLRDTSWKTRRPLYLKTLQIIHRLHCFPEQSFPSGRVRLMEGFHLDFYRWEQDYFREHFVLEVCRIELDSSFKRELEEELSSLAKRLLQMKRCLVHRDLQSQNVMIRDGDPFLIDFQGMRFGNPLYDLSSLLCDPYVHFSDRERDELLSFYYRLSKWNLDEKAFQGAFWEASAQRLMQALGAYGFLGLKKKLKTYLKYIPAGLRHLQQATAQVSTLPRLQELSQACQRQQKETAFRKNHVV